MILLKLGSLPPEGSSKEKETGGDAQEQKKEAVAGDRSSSRGSEFGLCCTAKRGECLGEREENIAARSSHGYWIGNEDI